MQLDAIHVAAQNTPTRRMFSHRVPGRAEVCVLINSYTMSYFRRRSTPIAVYCQTGNMSAAASEDLVMSGYSNVVDLAGGMNAWAAAGRPIEES